MTTFPKVFRGYRRRVFLVHTNCRHAQSASNAWTLLSPDLSLFPVRTRSIAPVSANGVTAGESSTRDGIRFTLTSSSDLDVRYVDTLKHFSHHTQLHPTLRAPRAPFHSPRPHLPPSARTAPTARVQPTSGSASSAETSAAVATAAHMHTHTMSPQHISTRSSSRPSASGTTPGTATSTG